MTEVAFFATAIGALGGAIAVIALRNPFYSVLALIVHLVSLAGLFLILHAEFVAAAQVVVYAGAIVVLYVFVAAYIGSVEESIWEPIPGQRWLAPLLAAALFIVLSIAVIGTGLRALETTGPTIPLGFGSPAEIGTLLLERFLVVFEAVSMILLLAAVGAVVLAGRRKAAEAAQATGERGV
jgi:NADH-quinone oxidoreductase subunit J